MVSLKTAYQFNQLSALIADDDPEFRKILSFQLKGLGLKAIHEATSGREGLKTIRRQKLSPDIIFLDIHMPFDAFQCCRTIKMDMNLSKMGSHIIVVSANSTEKNILLSHRFGADGFLTKPITATNLQQSLEDVLQRRREQKQRHGFPQQATRERVDHSVWPDRQSTMTIGLQTY